jgi:uncharacterized caspase-like protein
MTNTYTHGYALLIGVDHNQVAEWALPDVAGDVTALRDVLIHPERCAYDPAHVRLLSGTEASKEQILAGFDWLKQCCAQDSEATVVVYYSGHGWRDEQAQPPAYYFIPYNVSRPSLRSEALRAEEFAATLEALQPPRLFVVLDCCHAGGMQVKALGAPLTPAASPLDLIAGEDAVVAQTIGAKGVGTLTAGRGRAVLTSSQAEQPSYMSEQARMSLFTYALIEALTGSAQPKDGAQEVLVSDVLGYVYRRVPALAKQQVEAEQQPDGRLTGNFAIALLLGGKGLAAGQTPPSPLEPLPASAGQGKFTIGKIEAVNVAESQVIDQRGANFQIGGTTAQTTIHTGGAAYVGGSVSAGRDFIGRDQVNYAGPSASGAGDSHARLAGVLAAGAFSLAELQEMSEVVGVAWGDLASVEAADKAAALVERCAALGSLDRLKRMAGLLRPALKALLAG